MRVRHKKHGAERLAACSELLINSPEEIDEMPYGLEIGCGKGAFITQIASSDPGHSYVAVEIVRDVVVVAAEKIMATKGTDHPVENVRFIVAGAERLGDYIREGSISRIYINHPDPWPRPAHMKRRLTYASYLHMYWRFLKPDGEIWFKTDSRPLFDFSLRSFRENGFVTKDVTYDLVNSEYFASDVLTEYELSFIGKGQPIHRCVAAKDPGYSLPDVEEPFVTIGRPPKEDGGSGS
ncbi:MAG: tRNA (guanosine(46)-N7)-methyltransferase TrmB [Clostridiales bacterium]|nr:tRNA (guanosine(46)-N7)-methyltransferase TrmB [Clostridiales bacterium]